MKNVAKPFACRNRHRAVLVYLAVILVAALAPQSVVAQTPADATRGETRIRVHILPVENTSGNGQFDAVGTTVTGTVGLALRLLEDYAITTGAPAAITDLLPLPEDQAARESRLTALAERLEVENIVFGEVLPAPPDSASGIPSIRLAVFDRLSESITVDETRSPDSLFDIFSAVDELAADVLSGFSGRRIAFGSVRLAPERSSAAAGSAPAGSATPPLDYRVYLDNQEIGTNIRSIDSVLTGSHRLRITVTDRGQERIIYNQAIEIEEGRSSAISFVLPEAHTEAAPTASPVGEQEAALAAALEAIRAERATGGTEVAAGYYLDADSYLDPALVREEARENARLAAEAAVAEGRDAFATRDWQAGLLSHETAAQLGTQFDQEDTWGLQPDISFALTTGTEYEVQAERLPPVFLSVVAATAGLLPTLQRQVSVEPVFRSSPLSFQNQMIPLLPVTAGFALTTLWNVWDGSRVPSRRSLRAYGRQITGPPANPRFNPRVWEVTLSGSLGYYEVNSRLSDEGANAGTLTSGDSVQVNEDVFVPTAGSDPSGVVVGIRRWIDEENAVGVEYINRLGPKSAMIHFDVIPSGFNQRRDVQIFNTGVIDMAAYWVHTRTGGAFVRLGVAYRRENPDLERAIEDEASRILVEYLFGSGGPVNIWAVQVGAGTRFGRLPSRPWELGFMYQMDRTRYPDGYLSTSAFGPLYSHVLSARLTRTVGFGARVATESDADPSVRSIADARAMAESRWSPSRWSLVFDPVGFFGWGIRYGAEWAVTENISITGGIRSLRSEYWTLAGIMAHRRVPVPDFVALPGFGVRYYRGQPRNPDADGATGWYAGLYTEFMYFDGLTDRWSRKIDNRNTSISGTSVIPQIDLGYRFQFGGRFRLDAGTTIGMGVGEITLAYEQLEEGSDTVIGSGTEYYSNFFFNNFVLALIMPVY
jgi:hypothetical protein